MRFEELNLLNIKKTGASLLILRLNRKMKNVKEEFSGIRESFSRCLLGMYSTKKRVVIHLAFFMWTIDK